MSLEPPAPGPPPPTAVFDQLARDLSIRAVCSQLLNQLDRWQSVADLLVKAEAQVRRQTAEQALLERIAEYARLPGSTELERSDALLTLNEHLSALLDAEAEATRELHTRLREQNGRLRQFAAADAPFADLRPHALHPDRWPQRRFGTVVTADLVLSERYVELCRETGSPDAQAEHKDEVAALCDRACYAIGVAPGYHREGNRGEENTFGFESTGIAFKFAVAIHQEAERYNVRRALKFRLWFRVGMATGELYLHRKNLVGRPWSGDTLPVAARVLSKHGAIGSVVVNKDTYQHPDLTDDERARFVQLSDPALRKSKQDPIEVYEWAVCPHHATESDARR